MSDLIIAFDKTMINEGGGKYHKIKGDSGGATKWGISQKAFPKLDIKNLTKEEAIEIYQDSYWNEIKGDSITDQDKANKLFDIVVNIGVGRGVQMFQEVLTVLGKKIVIDQSFGNKTLEAINDVDKDFFIAVLKNKLAVYYLTITKHNRVYAKFLLGWMRRAMDLI